MCSYILFRSILCELGTPILTSDSEIFQLNSQHPLSHSYNMILDQYLTARSILNPGETLRYKIIFRPEEVGNYQHTYPLEIVGCPKKYYIKCTGECDIPKFDVTSDILFSATMKMGERGRTKLATYTKEINLFNFGPILTVNCGNGNPRRVAEVVV